MRSVTSCFNSTLYRKTMGRFWPLWALYGTIWLFALPLNLMTRYFDYIRWGASVLEARGRMLNLARDLPESLPLGVCVSLVFGVLCAMAAFGYLYNSRSACMMHALPLRRESLFSTQYLAGLSFLLLPLLVVALLTLAVEMLLLPASDWPAVLPALGTWLLAQSGTSLFFYSFAVFCAMFTGHVLALPVFYGVLNFLVMVVHTLVSQLMSQFFYGFTIDRVGGPFVEYCTPVYALYRACRWYPMNDGTPSLVSAAAVAAYAAAGLVFALLALVVYRYRHVESAGDVVAIPIVRPLFKCGVSFCSGLCLGIFTCAFFSWSQALPLTVCVLLWAAAGWFVAEMLLQKTFRVLHAWKGCAAMAAVLALLCSACFFDLFGIEDRVPDPAQVASVSLNGSIGYPYDSGNLNLRSVTSLDEIQQIVDLHRAVVREKDRQDYLCNDYISFRVEYTLSGGATLTRNYYSVPIFKDELNQEGSVTWQANRLIQNRTLIAQSYRFDEVEEQGRLVEANLLNVYNQKQSYFDTVYIDGYTQALWDAVRQDFDDGLIGVRYLFDDQEREENTYRTDLRFYWALPGSDSGYPPSSEAVSDSVTVTLTPQARRTLAVLKESGALGDTYSLVLHSQDPETGETWSS